MAIRLTPDDKARLLDEIARSWKEMQAALKGAAAKRLTAAPADGGWSVKDHLAHIVVWLRVIEARINGSPEHPIFGLTAEQLPTTSLDRLNELAEALHKNRPLDDVMGELERAHDSTLRLVGRLSRADLARPARPDKPDGPSLMDNIVGDTCAHYDEHLVDIKRLLGP